MERIDPRITEAQEHAKKACQAAVARTEEAYQAYLVMLPQNKKVGEVGTGKNKTSIYADIKLPYMSVDGRVRMAQDQHLEDKGTLAMHTSFHEIGGEVLCRAVVTSSLYGETVAHARVGVGGVGVDRTNPYENAECVPLSTEILTREGFKFYTQVQPGDLVLTHNVTTAENAWQPLLAVRTFHSQPLVRLANTNGFSVTCTPNHRWVLRHASGRTALVPLDEIPLTIGTYRLIVTAPEEKTRAQGDPVRAAQLGWIFSDAERHYTSGLISRAEVNQSKPKHFQELTELFGEGVPLKKYAAQWQNPYVWAVPAREVREICAPYRVNAYSDLSRALATMTLDEVRAFFTAVMHADGCGEKAMGKSHPALIDAMQVACARLGIRVNSVTVRTNMTKQKKPFYILNMQKTVGPYVNKLTRTLLPPADVWCPTTANGTWIARQPNGAVFITGNTSAIGRALGFMGYGLFGTGIASAEEVMQARETDERPSTPTRPMPMMTGPRAGAQDETDERPASERQLSYLRTLLERTGTAEKDLAVEMAAATRSAAWTTRRIGALQQEIRQSTSNGGDE